MSIINNLKEALESANWDLVSEVFFDLTGETITVSEPEPQEEITDPNLKFLLQRIEKLEQKKPEPSNFSTSPVKKNSSSIQAKTTNAFLDMDITVEDDPVLDKIDDNVARVPRKRKRYKDTLVSKKCDMCDKTFQVKKSLAQGSNFVCDACAPKYMKGKE